MTQMNVLGVLPNGMYRYVAATANPHATAAAINGQIATGMAQCRRYMTQARYV